MIETLGANPVDSGVDKIAAPGRSCPLGYRYSPGELARAQPLSTATLYVVGGLYGNEPALQTVLSLFAREPEPKHLLFNGDFNWFNVDRDRFCRINRTVLAYDALRGNVETELAGANPEAGCGCAYPEWVDEGVVERSNRIMQRLAATAADFPELRSRLGELPRYRVAQIGAVRAAVVHGDAESLAGWGFAWESVAGAENQARLGEWFAQANVEVFACSHTCLPVLRTVATPGGWGLIANNGAAGMPNFTGGRFGLLTRLSTVPYRGTVRCYGTRLKGIYVDALAIHYDHGTWLAQFLADWPPGSPAHRSYWQRIDRGPEFTVQQAVGAVPAPRTLP